MFGYRFPRKHIMLSHEEGTICKNDNRLYNLGRFMALPRPLPPPALSFKGERLGKRVVKSRWSFGR